MSDRLYNQIDEYCKFNNIKSLNDYIFSLIEKGFLTEKYGDLNERLEPLGYDGIEFEKTEYNSETKILTLKVKGCEEEIQLKIKDFVYIKPTVKTNAITETKEVKIKTTSTEEVEIETTSISKKEIEPKKINKTRRKLTSR